MSSFRAALAASALVLAAASPAAAATAPLADYHMHAISPDAIKLSRADEPSPIPTPAELEPLLRARVVGWSSQEALAPLYAEDAVVLDAGRQSWAFGHKAAVKYMAEQFARPYRMVVLEAKLTGDTGRVAGQYVRGDGAAAKPFGSFLITLRKGGDRGWRIVTEANDFPGPRLLDPIDGDKLVAELDAAGIRKGVILSVAYWFGSPLMAKPEGDEYAKVKAENDWGAAQAARHPTRLVFFCSVNPLKDYAVAEVERCATRLHAKGLKMHFGNSVVDTTKPEHVAKVKAVFAAANRRGMALQPHLWTGEIPYTAAHARGFLENLLPAAPDVPVIIAHFAGGGPGYTDEALEVYAEAIQKGDPRTRNLYFDVATVADQQTPATLQKFAERIRQIGPRRVLFGHDAGPPAPRESWLNFRLSVPLTDAEFETIAANRMPYLD